MTYFYFPTDRLLNDDELMNDVICHLTNDVLLVDAINEDGVYVWNENDFDIWYDEEDEDNDNVGSMGPFRMQQYINGELVNDVYYTAEEDELIPINSNQTVYDNNHPSDDELLNLDTYLYVRQDPGNISGINYEYSGQEIRHELDSLCEHISCWISDWKGEMRGMMRQELTAGVFRDGLYFCYVDGEEYSFEDFPETNDNDYNVAFWVLDGKIVVKATAQDVLDVEGEISGIATCDVLRKYNLD